MNLGLALPLILVGLTWKPPQLTNPITIDLNSSPKIQRFVLDPNRDYLLRVGPDSKGFIVSNEIKIVGGRNIVLIGGHIKRAEGTRTNDPDTGVRDRSGGIVTLALIGQTGTTYVEGLLIDNNNQFGADGLDPGGSDRGGPMQSGDFILQNVRIENVVGTARATNGAAVEHADAIQVQGGVRSLSLDHVTVSSSYQGFNFQPEFQIGLVQAVHSNARYPDPDYHDGGANGYAFWLGDGADPNKNKPASYSFTDVYVQDRIDKWGDPWIKDSIAPDVTMPGGAKPMPGDPPRAYWTNLAFPNQTVTGNVTEGLPPGGDFVTESMIIDTATGDVIYRRQ